MRLFVLMFFLIYGSMHAYVFARAKSGLGFGWAAGIALALWMVLMVSGPLLVRASENSGLELTARVLSYVSYFWLGLLFFFVCAAFTLDAYRIVLWIAGAVSGKNLAAFIPSARVVFLVPLIYAVLASGYGYFEARNIRTETVVVKTSKLPPGIDTLRIVQISDVHLGLIVRKDRLGLILDKVKELKPDMFVSTGDLVDGQMNNMEGLAEMLREIQPRFGKYAITGNHEFYAGLDQALAFTKDAGFRMLRGEAVSAEINVAGVDDAVGRAFRGGRTVDEAGLLKDLPKDKFTLLLKHRPDIDKASLGLFDLQLSGHSHMGQLFPFYFVVRQFYLPVGMNDLGHGSKMYESRGSGTWGPPVRFLAPPEVTLIELERE